MQYFIGIIPPDEYKAQIVSFCNRWGSNRLQEIVEPHITVKAQGGLTEDMVWLERIGNACLSVPGFQLSLTEPAMFGTSVVFLGVRSKEIYELHKLLVDTASPSPELIKRYFELDHFHPHLTMGQTCWGMKESEIEKCTSHQKMHWHPIRLS